MSHESDDSTNTNSLLVSKIDVYLFYALELIIILFTGTKLSSNRSN